jgi:hypothetical protein
MKLAGFDMGRDYIAWSLLDGTKDDGFSLARHGIIYPPDHGDTQTFGSSLRFWEAFFEVFVRFDLEANACAAERFTYRPGGAGAAAEDINLRLPGMASTFTHLVRNTDWKSWFNRHVCADGTHAFFNTPTEHEADASGIALYLGCVILPRAKVFPATASGHQHTSKTDT